MCINALSTWVTNMFKDVPSFLGGLGTVMSVTAPIMYGKAAQESAEAQARAAEYNAQIEENKAAIAAERAAQEERKLRIKGALTKGTQRAAFGAAGLVPDAGSPLDVLLSTQWSIEQDAATIRYNAMLDQWGYGSRASLERYQADVARATGKQARTAGIIGGITHLGTATTRFSDKWDWMGQPLGR
jgi:hypothetical protein